VNVILLGAPGSGKGTQSIILNKKFGFLQLSTGEMIRQNIEDKTELGLKVQTLVNSGEFVNDDTILSMVTNRILMKDCKNGFVLDGFPRNVNQAKKFDKILKENNKKINIVIELKVIKKILFERIQNRAIQANEAREDAKGEVLENRIKIYEEQTEPLIPYYKDLGLHYEVNGMKKVDEIAKDIENIIKIKFKTNKEII
jgi:adenylate kinase